MDIYQATALVVLILWTVLFVAGFICSAKEQKQRTDKHNKQIQEAKRDAA
ncbi:MAG: hypothetical protein ACOX60_06190 [Massiliimalia sp.]|jgi:hypothetical protein